MLQSGATQHRDKRVADGRLSQCCFQLLIGDGLALQVLLQKRIVCLCYLLKHVVATLRHLVQKLGRNRHDLGSSRLFTVDLGDLLDEVDSTTEFGFSANGHLHRNRASAQPMGDHIHRAVKVRAGTIHLVHKGNPGNAILVGLAPHRFCLGLNTGNSVKNHHAAIQHPQAALYLSSEVHVPWGVDDVDVVAVPLAGGCRCGDRDAPFLFLGHPVHDRVPIVNVADLVRPAREEEHTLSNRRFTGVDMRDESDVSYLFQGTLPMP